jgi:hypothetical protein
MRFEERADPLTDEHVVVGDDDADHGSVHAIGLQFTCEAGGAPDSKVQISTAARRFKPLCLRRRN